MLGGTGKRGEKSRLTLAKIVRGIAAGDVRRFCEAREGMLRVRSPPLQLDGHTLILDHLHLCFGSNSRIRCVGALLQDLQQQVDALKRGPDGQQLATLQNENAELRLELDMTHRQLEAAGGAAPRQVTARPLVAADLPALDTGKWSAWRRPPFNLAVHRPSQGECKGMHQGFMWTRWPTCRDQDGCAQPERHAGAAYAASAARHISCIASCHSRCNWGGGSSSTTPVASLHQRRQSGDAAASGQRPKRCC